MPRRIVGHLVSDVIKQEGCAGVGKLLTRVEPGRRAGHTEVLGRLWGLPSSELAGELQRGM